VSKSFLNGNYRSVVFGITCLKKDDRTKVATQETSYFQWCNLNGTGNKIDVVVFL